MFDYYALNMQSFKCFDKRRFRTILVENTHIQFNKLDDLPTFLVKQQQVDLFIFKRGFGIVCPIDLSPILFITPIVDDIQLLNASPQSYPFDSSIIYLLFPIRKSTEKIQESFSSMFSIGIIAAYFVPFQELTPCVQLITSLATNINMLDKGCLQQSCLVAIPTKETLKTELQLSLIKRTVFEKVKYTERERENIEVVRTQLNLLDRHANDATILRYLSVSDNHIPTCLSKLMTHLDWQSNPSIQRVESGGLSVLQSGFVYSCPGGTRPCLVLNLGRVDLQHYSLLNYYQALNAVMRQIIENELIPGENETMDCLLDFDQKFLSLPMTSIKDIVGVISDVYATRLERLRAVNCTTMLRFIYQGFKGFLDQQTNEKIRIYTRNEVQDGALFDFLPPHILEQKYGGKRRNIDHSYQPEIQLQMEDSHYFSIEEEEIHFQIKGGCCGGDNCTIY